MMIIPGQESVKYDVIQSLSLRLGKSMHSRCVGSEGRACKVRWGSVWWVWKTISVVS